MIFENSESKPVKQNLDQILALLKKAYEESIATTQATTAGASGKKRAQSAAEASSGAIASAVDMEGGNDGEQDHPMHKMPRHAMQELCQVQVHSEAVVAFTQNLKACNQELLAMGEKSQEVQNFVQKTLAQKNAVSEYRTEFELLGTAIETTAKAFVNLANGKGLYVDQEARHSNVKREDASIEADRQAKLLDFQARMSVFEDRNLERAKAYADLEARKSVAPPAVAVPPDSAPAPAHAPAPPADEEEDEGPYTVRDVMKKYNLLEGIRKNHHSAIVLDAGGRAYNAHVEADRVFLRKVKRGDYYVRVYATEDVPHVLAACEAAIRAYRETHPLTPTTQRTLDNFVVVAAQ